MLDDKEYYLRATREFEEKKLDEELWAKVIALADGDEEKAKFEYIKKRARKLQSEEFVETKFVPVVKRSFGGYLNPKNLSIYNFEYVFGYLIAMIVAMAAIIPFIIEKNEANRHWLEPERGPDGPGLVVAFLFLYFLVFVLSHFIAVTYGYIYKFFNKAAVLDDIKRKTMTVLLAICCALSIIFAFLTISVSF